MEGLDDLRKQRLEKLNKLIDQGVSPFAYRFDRTHLSKEVIDRFGQEKDESFEVTLAGRLMSIRRMGKASFGHLMDRTGRIQVYVKQEEIGEDGYAVFKLLDIGDIVGVKGMVFRTKTGEVTVLVRELSLLSKTMRPLPIVKEKMEEDEKIVYDAFADKELRYRQRYVDLVVNQDVKHVFELRSRIISSMRRYLEGRGYIEVETPALQPIYGGAFARPFVTHHNALDVDFYLRIADELYLKRLIVGGLDGVFEIAKDFRNEGMDRDHTPEFTMMELYVAYEDYHFMMDLVEEMMRIITKDVFGKTEITYEGKTVDFASPWERVPYFEAIRTHSDFDLYKKSDEELLSILNKMNLDIEEAPTRGMIFDEVFSRFVEPKLVRPTFITDYPVEISPLAKKHRSKEGLAERFEGFVAGKEICNAFSELNDPLDQRERFEDQAKQKAAGDEEAMVIDEDYLRAMEYGMPPTAGLGLGVDRLVMLLTDTSSIRDVILFPQMRPEKNRE
ncbi:MAG: lysine--tRNA ligase [bacterium]